MTITPGVEPTRRTSVATPLASSGLVIVNEPTAASLPGWLVIVNVHVPLPGVPSAFVTLHVRLVVPPVDAVVLLVVAVMLPVGGAYCADAPAPRATAIESAISEANATILFMLDLHQTRAAYTGRIRFEFIPKPLT